MDGIAGARNSRSVRQNRLRRHQHRGRVGRVARSSMTTDACGKPDARGRARPVWRAKAGKRNRSNSVTAPPFDPTSADRPSGCQPVLPAGIAPLRTAASSSRPTRVSSPGGRCSAIRCWPPPSSTACCIIPARSISKARASGSRRSAARGCSASRLRRIPPRPPAIQLNRPAQALRSFPSATSYRGWREKRRVR